MIAAFEESRRRTEGRAGAPSAAPSSLTTADLGRLDRPVDGSIEYRFGRVINANNTAITWEGIGIGAAIGTGVKAVAQCEVVFAEPNGTYGRSIFSNMVAVRTRFVPRSTRSACGEGPA